MAKELSPSARKVQDVPKNLGLDCTVMELSDSTRTAIDAADAVGCQVGQIVKSLIFKGKKAISPFW